eukprot:scaffold40981_cov48-Phaeocystis_antarctica.AAC.4
MSNCSVASRSLKIRSALLPPGWLRDHFLQSIFLPWMCTKNSSSAVASDADPRPPLPMREDRWLWDRAHGGLMIQCGGGICIGPNWWKFEIGCVGA